MGKVNFTAEDFNKLKEMVATAVIDNVLVSGPMGQIYNVYELVHTLSIRSLRSLSASLTKKRADLAVDDGWVENPNEDKIAALDFQVTLISYIIGYKLREEEKRSELIEKEAIMQQLAELERSQKSPAEIMEDLRKRLAELS